MSKISIDRPHNRSHDQAIELVKQMAEDLHAALGAKCNWESEDKFSFKQSGAKGTVNVDASHLHIHLSLGMMVAPMKGMIEAKIHSRLDKMLG